MPSPVGHALGGIAAGCAIFPSRHRETLVWFAVAGMFADVDLLFPIAHRGPTHSLVAAAVAFASALLWLGSRRRKTAVRLAMAVGAAYATHVLFDWLGEDSGPPSGIMALWPFTHEYYVSGLDIFHGVDRRYWLPGFWRNNLISIAREIIILTPIILVIVTLMRRASGRPHPEVE